MSSVSTSEIAKWNPTVIYTPGHVVYYVGSNGTINYYTIYNGFTSILGTPPINVAGTLNSYWSIVGLGGGGIIAINGGVGFSTSVSTNPTSIQQIPVKYTPLVRSPGSGASIALSNTPAAFLVSSAPFFYNGTADNYITINAAYSITSATLSASENITTTLYKVPAWSSTVLYMVNSVVGIPTNIAANLTTPMYISIGTSLVGTPPNADPTRWTPCAPTTVGSGAYTPTLLTNNYSTATTQLPIATTITIFAGIYGTPGCTYTASMSAIDPVSSAPTTLPMMYVAYASSTNNSSSVIPANSTYYQTHPKVAVSLSLKNYIN